QVNLALTALANVTLQGQVSPTALPLTIPFNQVAGQNISPGTSVSRNTTVTLTVQSLTIVPNVVGLDITTAQTTLIAAFLSTTAPATQVSSVLSGTVLAQSIAAGTGEVANTVVSLTIAIAGDGFRVQAVTAGYYNGQYYEPGEVFDLLQATDFSDSSVNYQVNANEYAPGWMQAVSTPVSLDTGAATFPAVDPARRTVM